MKAHPNVNDRTYSFDENNDPKFFDYIKYQKEYINQINKNNNNSKLKNNKKRDQANNVNNNNFRTLTGIPQNSFVDYSESESSSGFENENYSDDNDGSNTSSTYHEMNNNNNRNFKKYIRNHNENRRMDDPSRNNSEFFSDSEMSIKKFNTKVKDGRHRSNSIDSTNLGNMVKEDERRNRRKKRGGNGNDDENNNIDNSYYQLNYNNSMDMDSINMAIGLKNNENIRQNGFYPSNATTKTINSKNTTNTLLSLESVKSKDTILGDIYKEIVKLKTILSNNNINSIDSVNSELLNKTLNYLKNNINDDVKKSDSHLDKSKGINSSKSTEELLRILDGIKEIQNEYKSLNVKTKNGKENEKNSKTEKLNKAINSIITSNTKSFIDMTEENLNNGISTLNPSMNSTINNNNRVGSGSTYNKISDKVDRIVANSINNNNNTIKLKEKEKQAQYNEKQISDSILQLNDKLTNAINPMTNNDNSSKIQKQITEPNLDSSYKYSSEKKDILNTLNDQKKNSFMENKRSKSKKLNNSKMYSKYALKNSFSKGK